MAMNSVPARRIALALIAALGFFGSAHALTFSTIYKFCVSGSCASDEGTHPAAGVVVDSAGNVYGTTQLGGLHSYGTVFKLTPSGGGTYTRTTIYNFCSLTDCVDGGQPVAGLVLDDNGNLYGTTSSYGHFSSGQSGTVFKLHPTGGGSYAFTILHSFCAFANCADGRTPLSGLAYTPASPGALYDGTSALYGTTQNGGASTNNGVVYQLTPAMTGTAWNETVLYQFCPSTPCTDGDNPVAGVVSNGAGDTLYGVAGYGAFGSGVVYQLAKSGSTWSESVIYNFCDPNAPPACDDGKTPNANLLIDSDSGDLYGTTSVGGDSYTPNTDGSGIVFRLHNPGGCTSSGVVEWCQERLYSFCPDKTVCSDGFFPANGFALYRDSAGHLWGAANYGGANHVSGYNGGAVFKMTGTHLNAYHRMQSFCDPAISCGDGSDLFGGLAGDASGNLYGTTYAGGNSFGSGTVYKIVP
jgi:uncharacterized repeat protein (TIGR03803 family)